MLSSSNLLIGLRIAFRARFGWLAGGSSLALALAALLSAEFSGRQPATVALDIGLSVIRLLLPLILVLMTQELLSREFDRRYFLNTLSYPRPRYSLVLGRFMAIAALMLGLLLQLACILAILVWLIGQNYVQGTPVSLDYRYLITIAFIGIDVLLLAAIATLFAVAAPTSGSVLIGTLGFMLIARSYGAVVELLTRRTELVSDVDVYSSSIGVLSYLLPDLGALDVRMITLYGKIELLPPEWPWLILTALAYMTGALALSVWALQRKRFA